MKWIRDRDALIAQTLSFVQSVTGRKDVVLQPEAPTADPPISMEIMAVEAVAVEIEAPPEPPRPAPLPCPGQAAISAPRCRSASPISANTRSASSANGRNIVRRP